MTRNRTSAAVSGTRSPCSHCFSVLSGSPKRLGNAAWDSFIERRKASAAAIAVSMRRSAKEPVDIAQPEPAIGERAVNALRHQVDRAHVLGNRAEIAFGDADDRDRAALQSVHQG